MSESNEWMGLSDEELLALSDADFEAATADIASLLHEGPLAIEPEQPSSSLWDAIVAGANESVRGTSDPLESMADERPLAPVQPLERRRQRSGPAFTSKSRWSGRTAALTLVAACLLLVLVPLGLSMQSNDDPADVIAAVDLEVLDDSATSGHADLVREDNGAALDLAYEATAPSDEYLELWLLAVDDAGEIETLSLGRLDGDGTYEVPADVDRTRFNIVDISIEADDGDAAHSGRSILRGQLVG